MAGNINIGIAGLFDAAALDNPRILASGASLFAKARDNIDFIAKFDPSVLGSIVRPTRTVVVSQNPPAGDFVPAGTPINLTLTVKQTLPLGAFKVDAAFAGKYVNIGPFLDDVENPQDAISLGAKSVLEKDIAYDALAANDRQAIDSFMRTRFGEAAGTAEQSAKLYNDMKFVFKL